MLLQRHARNSNVWGPGAPAVCDTPHPLRSCSPCWSRLQLFCFITFGLEVVLGSVFVDKYFLRWAGMP